MKRIALKSLLSTALVIGMLLSVFSLLSAAATNSKGYEEVDGWINENPNAPQDYAYSIAVVGDTQTVLKKDLANGTTYMSNIYDWIVDNADSKKIQFVLGLGDIAENDTDEEWVYAKSNITKLDGVLPYLLNRGNSPHDSVKQLNKYFADYAPYINNISGTMKDGNVANAYAIYTVGSTKYLVLALDYGPSDAELAWAEEVILANPDCKVIITTHAYLYTDGTTQGAGDGTSNPNSTGSDDGANNNGEQMWGKLVKKYENIVLVLSGHNPSKDIVYNQSEGDNGNVVTSLLVDSQNFDAGKNGETGMVCMLYFSADGKTMHVEWISTVREQYLKAENQFKLDITKVLTDVQTKYGIIPAQYADSMEYPFIIFQNIADGKGNDYTFFAAKKTLAPDTTLGLSENPDLALHSLRSAGEGAVLLMRRDYVNTATGNYTNLCYNGANSYFDLGGHTLIDKHTSTSGLFYCYAKTGATKDITFNIINGTILLGEKALTSYTGATAKSINLVFDGVTISFQEGSELSNVFGRYKGSEKNLFSVVVKNSVIDLKNGRPGINLLTDENNPDALSIRFENTEIINSKILVPKISMTLSDNFIVNVYVPVNTSSGSDCVIKSISFDGVEYELNECEVTEIGTISYYVFSKPVSPTAAAENIELKVNLEQTFKTSSGVSTAVPNSGTWTFSVVSYLEKLCGASSTIQKTLAKDILSYIKSMYRYFGDTEIADEVCDKIDSLIGEGYNSTSVPTDIAAIADIRGLDGATIRLGSSPAYIFYPETDENGNLVYDLDDYVFALDGKYRLNTTTGVDENGSTYILVSMYAYAIDNTVEYVINGTNIHGRYNIKTYYNYATTLDDTELVTLVERLWKYAQSAEAYKNTLK